MSVVETTGCEELDDDDDDDDGAEDVEEVDELEVEDTNGLSEFPPVAD